MQASVARGKTTHDGVKEHTANSGRGRGAASERRPAGTTVKSSARTFHATTPYRSKLEAAWANHLNILTMAREIDGWHYEPQNFRLPGQKNFYKIDFLTWKGQAVTYYEVKGRNLSDDRSLVKLKTAAGLHPWARFVQVKRDCGAWNERVIA